MQEWYEKPGYLHAIRYEMKVLDALKDGPATRRAIAHRTGLTDRSVRRVIERYIDDGTIEKVGGQYRLTQVNRQIAGMAL